MFEGFRREFIAVDDIEIHAVVGGNGPPLLMLHGYPQCHVNWHKIAPRLAEQFTVVCPDLRGYGYSSKPRGDDDHVTYSKRAMADDQVAVMAALGFDRFALVGHDRGARVAHRLVLDHQELVHRVALLDIVPSLTFVEAVNGRLAQPYYYWFLLAQPEGIPEHLIGLDPEFWLSACLKAWSADDDAFTPEALDIYLETFADPTAIHATCEDYRAGLSIDLDHDRADRAADHRIECPLLVLWGERGLMCREFDILETWQDRAVDVTGFGLDCGHFLAEERPDETTRALLDFLTADD